MTIRDELKPLTGTVNINEWMTVADVAKRDKVTAATVLNRIRDGAYDGRLIFGKTVIKKKKG